MLQYNGSKSGSAFEVNWFSVSVQRQSAEIKIRIKSILTNGTSGKVPDSLF